MTKPYLPQAKKITNQQLTTNSKKVINLIIIKIS